MNETPRQSLDNILLDGRMMYLRSVPVSSWLAKTFPGLVSTSVNLSIPERKLNAALNGAMEFGWEPPNSIPAFLGQAWFDNQPPRIGVRAAKELRRALWRAAEYIPGEEADEQEVENVEWCGSELRYLAGQDNHWLVKLIYFLRTSGPFEILWDISVEEPEIQAVE